MRRRIGDLASEAGISVETVRFYEREGLIDQPGKPARGWRNYNDVVQIQLGLVRLGQLMGLRLADIKRLRSRAARPEPEFCAEVKKTVTMSLAAVEAEISALQKKREALQNWLNQCQHRDKDIECPLYSQVRSLSSRAQREGG